MAKCDIGKLKKQGMIFERHDPPYMYTLPILPFSFSFFFSFACVHHIMAFVKQQDQLHFPTSIYCDLHSQEACMPTWMFWPMPELLEPKLFVSRFPLSLTYQRN
jgi:hypothetical protein